jgi:cytochrome c2
VTRRLLLLGLFLLIGAGCGRVEYPTPTTRPTITPRIPTATVQATEAAATLAPAEALPGDPAAGDVLFRTFQPRAGIACTGCHRVDSDDRLIGPGLMSVGIRAQTRVAGQSAQEYIRTSIIDPSAYIVEGYANLMPKNWKTVFSEQQVNDVVAYLISLSES